MMAGKRSILATKTYFQRHKQHGILFYPNDSLAVLGLDDEFELYMAYRPILSCKNAFPVSYRRYRHYKRMSDQIKYFAARYEAYYEEPAPDLSFFDDLLVHMADEFLWFYNLPEIGSEG